ncbi:MAG: GAF domain-containing protein [Anaerolineales bacterium]
MLENLLNLIRSEEDHDPSFIRLVRNILILVMIINFSVLLLVTGIVGGAESRNITAFTVLATALGIEAVSFYFVIKGNVLLAKVVVPIALVLGISIIAINTNGVRDTSFFSLPVILVVSAMLLGKRSITIITPLAVIAAAVTAIIDIRVGRQAQAIALDDVIIIPLLMAGSGAITHLLIVRLSESTLRAQKSEQMQKEENAELLTLRATLEERVHERTAELELANQINEKRAQQFSAIAKVMNAISSVQTLDELLPFVAQVISEEFNVYHVGIFLLDSRKELAVLRAANSEGGKRMLARNHSLAVGQTGIVGFVTATGQPRIALDVGADSVYFDNPDLPDTRSEIALPLRYAGQIIGALDVQSLEADAFKSDDVAVLTTLADQVTVAINNALTIEDAKRALAEARTAIGQVTEEAWQVLRPAQLGLGFSYSESGVKPLQNPIDSIQIHEALQKGQTMITTSPDHKTVLAVPIRLRGSVIGVMQLSNRSSYEKLTQEDADIAEAVVERLSLAIETATLLQSTQHRADIEKVTANITSKVSSSARFETILQTAAQELSRALGGSDVLVQIEPAALKMYT